MSHYTPQVQSIPSNLATEKSPAKNAKFFIGGLLLLGLVVALMVQATISTGAYYMTVGELQEKGPSLLGERVRVSGTVVEGSEDWNPQEIVLRFAISGEEGGQLPIVFEGPRPDNFQRAASAIVEGELKPDGTFHAKTLLLKCPSRYEEEPEEIFVQANQ
ncbi:MAG: cytochrome c maturation protein CcmE [Caldilineaceae bacterium]|nr:cytochrome c maturation protein CcmE [Caldilineaceae bacterium]